MLRAWRVSLSSNLSLSLTLTLLRPLPPSFLNGDSKIIYRVGLALLRINHRAIMAGGFEDIMAILPGLPTSVKADDVWDAVWNTKVKTEEIEALEKQYTDVL